MIWSKIKRNVTALLAASVRPHLGIHMARYGPGVSTYMTRAWLTWDKITFANFATAAYYHAQRDGTATDTLFASQQFVAALATYIASPITVSLASANPLVRGIAQFDRRLGQRRLQELAQMVDAAPFVTQCRQYRMLAEGLAPAAGT